MLNDFRIDRSIEEWKNRISSKCVEAHRIVRTTDEGILESDVLSNFFANKKEISFSAINRSIELCAYVTGRDKEDGLFASIASTMAIHIRHPVEFVYFLILRHRRIEGREAGEMLLCSQTSNIDRQRRNWTKRLHFCPSLLQNVSVDAVLLQTWFLWQIIERLRVIYERIGSERTSISRHSPPRIAYASNCMRLETIPARIDYSLTHLMENDSEMRIATQPTAFKSVNE